MFEDFKYLYHFKEYFCNCSPTKLFLPPKVTKYLHPNSYLFNACNEGYM